MFFLFCYILNILKLKLVLNRFFFLNFFSFFFSQVIKEVLKNPEDKTQLSLIFANETEDDILLKSTIDELVAKHKNLKVTYVLSKPPTR